MCVCVGEAVFFNLNTPIIYTIFNIYETITERMYVCIFCVSLRMCDLYVGFRVAKVSRSRRPHDDDIDEKNPRSAVRVNVLVWCGINNTHMPSQAHTQIDKRN